MGGPVVLYICTLEEHCVFASLLYIHTLVFNMLLPGVVRGPVLRF